VRQQQAGDQVDSSRGDRQERLHDGVEALADHLLADFQVGQALVLLVVAGGVARLVAESLRQQHPGHRQGFLAEGAHRRQRLLGRARHLAAPLADHLGQPEEHRNGDDATMVSCQLRMTMATTVDTKMTTLAKMVEAVVVTTD
jgi:hypothetical protein